MSKKGSLSVLPNTDELAEALLDLAVPHQDIDEAVRLTPRVSGDAQALRFLEEAVADLVQDMGGIRRGIDVPVPPARRERSRAFSPVRVRRRVAVPARPPP